MTKLQSKMAKLPITNSAVAHTVPQHQYDISQKRGSHSDDRSKYQDFLWTLQHYKSQKLMTYSTTYYGLLTCIRQQKLWNVT